MTPQTDQRAAAPGASKTQEQLLAEILDVMQTNEAHTDAIRSMVRLVGSIWLLLLMFGGVAAFFVWGHLHHAACSGFSCQ